MKVLFTTDVPASYRVQFFNELGKCCELTVLFEKKAEEIRTRSKGWIGEEYKNFRAVFMNKIKLGKNGRYVIAPEIVNYVQESYDIIIVGVYSTLSAMLAIVFMQWKRIPYYIEVDGGIAKEGKGLKEKFKKLLISQAKGYFSSGKMTDQYLETYGATKEKIMHYPFTSLSERNLLEKACDMEGAQEIRKECGIKEKYVIVSVGQFIYRKGFDVLIHATKNISKDVGVYIIGGEPTKEYLDMRKDVGGNEKIHFIGFLGHEELSRFYKAADIFVLPTREDIWGLVVNEAMAYGLPVVTTNKCVAGIELVEDDINGYIVHAGDEEGLANAINRFFEKSYDEQIIMKQESLRKIREYTIENMSKVHMEAFRNIMTMKQI